MKSKTYIPEIDSLRAAAVMLVMAHHWGGDLFKDLPVARFGVKLFFVISGFLITGILLAARDRVDAKTTSIGHEMRTFYARRALRIFPVYYGILAMSVLAGFNLVVEPLLWHLLYASNIYIASQGAWQGYTSHLWSLAVEEQFYAFWPLAILLVPRRLILPAICAMIASAPLFRLALSLAGASPISALVLTPSALDTLGCGALLAYAQHHGLDVDGRIRPWALGGGLLLLATYGVGAFAAGSSFVWTLQDTASAIVGLSLIHWITMNSGAPALAILRIRPVLYLGSISYGLYLYHLFVAHIVNLTIPAGTPYLVRLAVFLGGTVLAAAASWRFFEQPINHLKRHFPYEAGGRLGGPIRV